MGGGKDFENISVTVLFYRQLLFFEKLQDFHKLMKDVWLKRPWRDSVVYENALSSFRCCAKTRCWKASGLNTQYKTVSVCVHRKENYRVKNETETCTVRQLPCVCISKHEWDCMCLLGWMCLNHMREGAIPWEHYMDIWGNTCASWTVNENLCTWGRSACWNIDGSPWRNASSVTLKMWWIFQWPGGVGTLGVKLEGNYGTIMGISLQNKCVHSLFSPSVTIKTLFHS